MLEKKEPLKKLTQSKELGSKAKELEEAADNDGKGSKAKLSLKESGKKEASDENPYRCRKVDPRVKEYQKKLSKDTQTQPPAVRPFQGEEGLASNHIHQSEKKQAQDHTGKTKAQHKSNRSDSKGRKGKNSKRDENSEESIDIAVEEQDSPPIKNEKKGKSKESSTEKKRLKDLRITTEGSEVNAGGVQKNPYTRNSNFLMNESRDEPMSRETSPKSKNSKSRSQSRERPQIIQVIKEVSLENMKVEFADSNKPIQSIRMKAPADKGIDFPLKARNSMEGSQSQPQTPKQPNESPKYSKQAVIKNINEMSAEIEDVSPRLRSIEFKKSMDSDLILHSKQEDGKYKIVFSNGYYVGDLIENKRTGRGKYVWNNGNCYEGCWKDDLKHGLGEFTWSNGDKYFGMYQNDYRHGKGTKTYSFGDMYDGDWVGGKKEGKGMYLWKVGDKYEGEFKRNQKSGKGIKEWKNGCRYVGDWKHDKMDGKGEFSWPEGDVYVGDYCKGFRTGHGTKRWSSGTTYTVLVNLARDAGLLISAKVWECLLTKTDEPIEAIL